MKTIHVLDKHLQNKIAAGEVVDRPSAVVKELVENAIDANATLIQIQVKESGMESIRIIDNGDGIYKDDAPLLFERHATSKISHDYDLFQVKALGFRGEALASIGAVSIATVESFHPQSESFLMVHKGGVNETITPGKERQGTDIRIEQIFFNTPARLKYVKNLNTESGKIIDVVTRMSLAHPHIAFHLSLDGRTRIETKGNGNLHEVISDIYGYDVAKNLININEKNQDFTIKGYIGKPEVNRSNRNYISLSINKRHIKDYQLSESIIHAYHTMLAKNKYPIVVLDIEMDPKLVDVNVHPTKLHVKISKTTELYARLTSVITKALRSEPLIPTVSERSINAHTETQAHMDFSHDTNIRVDESVSLYHEALLEKDLDTTAADNSSRRLPYFEVVGQLHGTYIVLQNDTGMYLMDQHAAEERIKYEYFYENVGVSSTSEQLLIPYRLEFPSSDVVFIEQKLDELKNLGFVLEKSGAQGYVVYAYPSWINRDKAEVEVNEVIEYIIDRDTFNLNDYREALSIMLSCKQSIKANRYLNAREIDQLIEDLRACHSPFTCPHGRPVIIHYDIYSIEKQFNRVMK